MERKAFLRIQRASFWKFFPVFLLAVGLLPLPAHSAPAASGPGETVVYLAALPFQDLLDLQVTTVSRKQESVLETAAATYVITADDIRRSGVTSIAEALRMVPGFEAGQQTSSVWNINARGGNNRFANSLLVLIDNRSVYTPLFGGVYWDIQDVLLEDIDRIEVIRGPGASLWGSNAINGVVNVVTKSARETQGALVSLGAGNEDRATVSGRYGGKMGAYASYRLDAMYRSRDGLASLDGGDLGDDWHTSRAGFRVDWDRSSQDTLTVSGNIYDGTIKQFSSTIDSIRETDVRGGHVLGRWERRLSDTTDLAVQLYYDRTERHNNSFGEDLDTVDLDFQHRFSPFPAHDLVWGLGYRGTRSATDENVAQMFNPVVRSDTLISGFVQDDIAFFQRRVRLILGSKFEHNDYTGFEVQPSAKFVVLPSERTVLWGSVSRSLTIPNRHNTDVKLEIDIPGMGPWVVLQGNPDLDEEDAIVYELGVRHRMTDNLFMDLAAFYVNQDNVTATNFDEMGTSSFENARDVDAYGMELFLQYRPAERWKISASYSFLQVESRSYRGSSAAERGEDTLAEAVDPEHQFQVHAYVNLPFRLEFDSALYYVDRLPFAGHDGLPTIDAYARLDLRLAWKPLDGLELSVVARNLLDPEHQETPHNGTLTAGQVQRDVFGKVTWTF